MVGRGQDITAQVALVLLLGLAVAFGAAAALALTKFSEALEDTVAARYAVHASDLRTVIETGINLGLDVEAIAGNVEQVVEDRFALDSGILEVVVAGPDGQPVLAMARPGTAARGQQDGIATEALPIRNSFGGTEGSVTVHYASAVESGAVSAVAALLARDVAVVTLLAGLLTTLACIVFVRPLRHALRAAADILAASADAPMQAAGATSAEPLESAARGAAEAARATLHDLDQIEERLPDPDAVSGSHGAGMAETAHDVASDRARRAQSGAPGADPAGQAGRRRKDPR